MSVHFYIDNVSHGGVHYSSYEVLKPEWVYNLSEPGTCTWSLALSQTDLAGGPIIPDEFAPKRHDYVLRASDGVTDVNLQGGRLLNVSLESDTGLITCSGKDWLEYLDQPYYFDGYASSIFSLASSSNQLIAAFIAAAGTDSANVIYNATQQKIINHILIHAGLLSDITYVASYSGTGWGQVLEYEIQFLDETSMLSHIQAISQYADPLGFDFWCNWNKQINFYSPRLVANPSSPTGSEIALSLTYGTDPVVKVSWNNSGPRATRTVGKNSTNIWKERYFPASVSAYRDELEVISLGQKYDFGRTYAEIQHKVDVATDAWGSFSWNPQKEITLTVLPERLFPGNAIAGFQPMLGKTIYFDSGNAFAPYHRINAYYYITSQSYRTDDSSGNYFLDFGLQQVYT